MKFCTHFAQLLYQYFYDLLIDIDIFQICRYIDYRYKHSIFHEQIGRKKQQNRLKTGKIIEFCTIFFRKNGKNRLKTGKNYEIRTHFAPLFYQYFYDLLIDINISQRLLIDIDTLKCHEMRTMVRRTPKN